MFFGVVGISALLLFQIVRGRPEQRQTAEISYSHFMSDVETGQVGSVSVAGNRIQGQYRESKGSFWLFGPNNPAIYLDRLRDKGVEVWFKDGSGDALPTQLLGTWAPLILLGALWFFMIRQMKRRGAPARGGEPPGSGSRLG